jgi:flagellar protein FliO/FliZ
MASGRGLLKTQALVLCAFLALGVSVVSTAQAAGSQSRGTGGAALGNAATDETTLVIGGGEAGAGNAGTAAAAPDSLLYFLRMLLVLAMVLGAMYLVFRLLRAIARPRQAEDSAIRVLSTTSLGSGRALHVVALGEKAWLVGATDASVNLLAPVEDRELVDGLLLRASQEGAAARPDFQAILGDFLGKRGRAPLGGGKPSAGIGSAGGFISRQRGRLGKFREPGA